MLPPLRDWQNFYVIVGSAAAALTGLQFVVVALSANATAVRSAEALEAFGTPTIVHLASVLTIAALACVPGHTTTSLATSLSLLGAAGVVYGILVMRRAKRQTLYTPVFEDWLWHVALPVVAYGALLITGAMTSLHPAGALYALAAVALALLFVAIHNAWDSAVYISVQGHGSE